MDSATMSGTICSSMLLKVDDGLDDDLLLGFAPGSASLIDHKPAMAEILGIWSRNYNQ